MSEPEAPYCGVTDDGDVYFSRPLGDWSDAELLAALRQVEDQVPALERALWKFFALYEQFASERDRRMAVYREVADALGLEAPGVDR